MNRLTDAWFEYAGTKSTDMGLRLLSMPRRYSPVANGLREEVPGRDGYLWIPDGSYMSVDISVDCETMDGYNLDEINAWLTQSGEDFLCFSDEPDRAYKAHVVDPYSAENRFLSFDRKRLAINFSCQPHRYEYPESEPVRMLEAGFVDNPGTIDSLPRVEVAATGDYTLTINGCVIDVTGGSIIIDSELRDCLSIDGTALANSRVTLSEFPTLSPGVNIVSWSGNVTAVDILRRVRYA